MQIRINQIIELHEMREKEYDRVYVYQENMKKIFDKCVKEENFQISD